MKKLLAANWKENPATGAEALRLFRVTASAKRGKNVEVTVCAPFVHLEVLSRALRKLDYKERISIGAQDMFWEDEGPYTGEIGLKMLKALGVRYVIVGHSDRRRLLNESNEMVNKKVLSALAGGLRVILCVGESLAVHKRGVAATRRFVKEQLVQGISGVRRLGSNKRNLFVTYEPIWAISKGPNDPGNLYDDPKNAAGMTSFLKGILRKSLGFTPPVLYGGSANIKNIADYVQYKEIDGALVGGASLREQEFKKMISTVSNL